MGRSRNLRNRAAVAAAVGFLVVTVLSAGAAASPSELAQSGTLTLTSDPGDFVGRGLTYSYATPENVFFALTRNWSGENNMVNVTMRTDPSSTDYWMLDFAAPPGQTLTPGSYAGVARAGASQGSGQPGLDVSGLGSGCNMLGGNFTVLEAAYGPYGYVERFHATFEQHCEFNAPALRGEVLVSNPPPPPALTASISLNPSAQLTRRGSVILSGSVTCNRSIDPDWSFLQLVVSEPSKKGAITGAAAIALPRDCSTSPIAWQTTVTPTDPASPFTKGNAVTSAYARLRDPFFDVDVQTDPTAGTVALKET
ncbi:MAG: hypothetical protein ACJ74A_08230 [Gaiellaceae bacterium]